MLIVLLYNISGEVAILKNQIRALALHDRCLLAVIFSAFAFILSFCEHEGRRDKRACFYSVDFLNR